MQANKVLSDHNLAHCQTLPAQLLIYHLIVWKKPSHHKRSKSSWRDATILFAADRIVHSTNVELSDAFTRSRQYQILYLYPTLPHNALLVIIPIVQHNNINLVELHQQILPYFQSQSPTFQHNTTDLLISHSQTILPQQMTQQSMILRLIQITP